MTSPTLWVGLPFISSRLQFDQRIVHGLLYEVQAECFRSNSYVRAEVVVAPVALHIPYVQEKLRKDFKVAAQNAWVKGSGAYTGEIRCVGSVPALKAANKAFNTCMSLMSCPKQWANLTGGSKGRV